MDGANAIGLNPILQNPAFIAAFEKKTIVMVAPASAASIDAQGINILTTLPQLNIMIPEGSFKKVIPYHSNTDAKRFACLKKALFDPSKDTVIWTLRGGYGSARLIEKLNKLPKPKTQKWFIGLSDVTALHVFLSQKWGWKTIHGAALLGLFNPNIAPENFASIADIVKKSHRTKKNRMLALDQMVPMNTAAEKTQKISAPLTGGNLTLLQTSIGTTWQIKTAGKILFLEDVAEKGYRIDRTLHHFKAAGLFKNVKAIIFGEFLRGDEHVTDALERFAQETKIPVFKSDQFGHGNKNNPLIYGAKADIVLNRLVTKRKAPQFNVWMNLPATI